MFAYLVFITHLHILCHTVPMFCIYIYTLYNKSFMHILPQHIVFKSWNTLHSCRIHISLFDYRLDIQMTLTMLLCITRMCPCSRFLYHILIYVCIMCVSLIYYSHFILYLFFLFNCCSYSSCCSCCCPTVGVAVTLGFCRDYDNGCSCVVMVGATVLND